MSSKEILDLLKKIDTRLTKVEEKETKPRKSRLGFLSRIKNFFKPKITQIEMVVLRVGNNLHTVFNVNNLDPFPFQIGQIHYKIETDALLLEDPTLKDRIRYRLKGIKRRYWIFFRDKKKAALKYESYKTISAETLGIIKTSRILGSSFKELFTRAFSGNVIIFVIIAVAVVGVAFLKLSGFI